MYVSMFSLLLLCSFSSSSRVCNAYPSIFSVVKKRVRLMDADTVNNASTSTEGVNTNEVEAESNTVDSLEVFSSNGNVMQEVGSVGEILTRLELDLACVSEKLVNLDLFVMHVETRESDFEAFASEKEGTSNDIIEKAMEFDLLSGVLDSEVTELGDLLSSVAIEIDNVRKVISSRGYVDEAFILIEEKLHDSEKSLKQSQDHLLELRVQCTNFHGIMLTSQGDQNWEDSEAADYFNGDALLTPKTKIKMQTVEQQRHILRMLEKSLARELDLEKKLTESRQVEEELEVRLQQEALYMEEEIEDASQKLFEGENAAEVLLGISKSLLGRLQMAHFNLNGTVQKESYLQSKLQEMEEHLKAKDNLLGKSENNSKELGDKVKSLEKRLEDSEFQLSNYTASAKKSQELECEILEMEDIINTLKEKNSEAERRIDTAETECKILKEANVELDKELNILKSSSSITSERINVLEKQLRDSELRLQHAVASAEASQEKQIMLNSTIKDMEDLIEDLKSKVSKAESLMESAEDKCIILSESNSDLNEELTFVRGRLACLKSSLCQAEEMKKATARDINFRSKLITDLILQLALERERLEKQIALLIMENKAQKKLFQQKDKVPSPLGKDTGESMLPKAELSAVTSPNECKEEISKFSSIANVEENVSGDFMSSESKETDSSTRLDALRDIDARQLNWKYVLTAVLVILISTVFESSLCFFNSMAEVSGIHRFHLPQTIYATVADEDGDDDDEEYSYPFAFDFDSLSPPNHTLFIHSRDFNYSPNSEPEPGSLDSDSGSDHSGLLADPDSFVVDDDQMNFVTDLFVTPDGNVSEDSGFDNGNRVVLEDVYGDFGSDFDGVLLPADSNGLDTGDGIRVVGIGLDSDSLEVELNAGDIDQPGVNGFWNCLRIDDERDVNDEFEWEEVNERGEDRDYLSSVIDGIEEISVSSDNSSSEGGNSNSHSVDEPVRNLEWEVLLAVNNIDRSLELDGNDDGIAHVNETDHDALFGQFLESEGTLKGSPPAAKSVVENLPLVVLKDEENKTACAVCKDEILVVEKVTELPCSHYYHWECIVPWLNIRNTCPVCRHELPTDDTDYERRKIGRRTGAGAQLISDFQVRYNFEIVP
ncbi:hypothetical protein RDI58_004556 [Solanum bulbocastanum]|uniref:RING-type E3 ubiquitin transferase n=1 Tax=Solanum bulbocastanum TaxID=147425 RepID=A0AAN8YLF8_SOLBU